MKKESYVSQIVQNTMNKKPTAVKSLVQKEIANRVLSSINNRRKEVATKLFSK